MSRMRGMPLRLWAIAVYLFLYAPIAVLVVFSFNTERINAVWRGFTLEWYGRLFHDAALLDAVMNSLIVGTISTIIATALGTVLGYGMARFDFRGKRIVDSILHLPIVIPDILMAIALLSFYVLVHFALGLVSIIIAHATFNIAFVAVVVRSRIATIEPTLESAALDLGATPAKAFRLVTLPLMMPGIIAGALLAFTLSWDDFMIAFFTSGVGATTLPLKVYSMIKFGVSPEVNAVSSLILFGSIVLILTALRVQGGGFFREVERQ